MPRLSQAMSFALVGSALVAFASAAASESCHEEPQPRAGGSFIQVADVPAASAAQSSASLTKTGAPPLKGRVVTLEAEEVSLENRVSILMETVGMTAEAAALLEKGEPYTRYMSLLHSQGEGSLKEAVGELETKVVALNSKILSLENQVAGNAFTAPSLLEKASKKTGQSGDGASLTSRIVALEEEVAKARSRVTSLEQTVSG